jgi:hypothetical protein
MTPFIGVRISWLMVARNSLFARVAASAWSRARASASFDCVSPCSIRMRSSMSMEAIRIEARSRTRYPLTLPRCATIAAVSCGARE